MDLGAAEALRRAVVRERRAPMVWWFGMALLMGGALYLLIRSHSPPLAGALMILLAGGWFAPVLAIISLTAPKRAKSRPPAPGTGSYAEWKQQARLLGRVLLYYEDIPNLSFDMRRRLKEAREDLRDTLRAHPLRDDLERVCGRIRSKTLPAIKYWLWEEYRVFFEQSCRETEEFLAGTEDPNARMVLIQQAVENSATQMSRFVMPRLLERERIKCMHECSRLTATVVILHGRSIPVGELAAMLVIMWSDFSEPWEPGNVVQRIFADTERERKGRIPDQPAESRDAPAPRPEPAATVAGKIPKETAKAAAAVAAREDLPEDVVIRGGKRYRRVRVRRKVKRRRVRHAGPGFGDILLSFGQWLRYSIRAWMLYR
ncbi:MAG: hypothetical protein GX803_08670 [Lentisphaerae bacterium]|jgi:hypothetical protein|nr:hypothetical protein [Lentisphaerota bacterium]